MALAARDAGYQYLAITDHSASFGFGDDLSPERLRAHIAADPRHRRWTGSSCWPAREVNILPDGSLDYDDEILAELDWVVASVHSSFRMDADPMTERIVRAIEQPAGRRDRPPLRAQDRDAARRIASTSSAVVEAAVRDRHDASRSTPAPTAAT